MNSSKKETLPPNMYNVFSNKKNDVKLPSLNDNEDDEDYFNIEQSKLPDGMEYDNIFILDPKLREQREKRLNEKDKMYKIKKHYFLKDSYLEMEKKEIIHMEMEQMKEKEYLDNCYKAEEKLYNGQHLTHNDIYYLFRRNYLIFNPHQRKELETIQRYYNSLKLGAAISSFMLITYCRAMMMYFKFELRSKIISYIVLGMYGGGLYLSFKHFINNFYENKAGKICFRAKDKILNYDNEHLKTPYNVDEKKYNPEQGVEQIFKI